METGSWKLETGQHLETGSWKLEPDQRSQIAIRPASSFRFPISNFRFPVSRRLAVIQADLIIEGAAELVTLRGNSSRPRRGEEMRDLGVIRQGALAARRGKIVWVGPTTDLLNAVRPL